MKRVLVAAGAYALCLGVMVDARGAPPATDNPWSGRVECKVETGGTPARTETQTWTLTGDAPTQQGAISLYPATWSATGKGDGLRGAWTLDAPAQLTLIAVFVRASDQRLIIKQGAALASVNGALRTTKPGIPLSANEWSFGTLEAEPAATRVSGSRQGQATALPAVLGAGAQATPMDCGWTFSKEDVAYAQSAAAAASPPAQLQVQRPENGVSGVLQRTAAPAQNPPASSGSTGTSTPAASGPKILDTNSIAFIGKGAKASDAELNVPLNLTNLNPMIVKVRVFCEVASTGLPSRSGSGGTEVPVVGGQFIGTVTVRMHTTAIPGTSMRYDCSLSPINGIGNIQSNVDFLTPFAAGNFTW